jgi:iron complex outermembrane receptor protein/hemoglobin/transferrin/lactoferrin receptor protein
VIPRLVTVACGLAVLAAGASVRAEDEGQGSPEPVEPELAAGEPEPAEGEPEPDPYESVVRARAPENAVSVGRAATTVSRRQIDERVPRSAPDALRYEPGTYVQQTAHGQASAYIRGLTGQQTVLLFDGIRLNNATFRQGPNQYFFTVDSNTIAAIEVARGSASVIYGSDALGGVINGIPIEPRFLATTDRWRVTPRTTFLLTTADDMRGGRFQLEAQAGQRFALLAGVGYRTAGLLESGGPVYNPSNGELPEVPRFAEDVRTQLGTGFDELTFDGRLVVDLGGHGRLVTAVYGYRGTDIPRTDQCPPAYAPYDVCMTYDEQYRTLAYATYAADLGRVARDLRISLSYQNQHELRRLEWPSSRTRNMGEDDVHSVGLVARGVTAQWEPWRWLGLRLRYGTDLYVDWLASSMSTTFTDVEVTMNHSRGLYLDGSSYVWWGIYLEGEANLPYGLTVRLGGRAAVMHADAPGDEESDSIPVDQTWFAPVGRAGLNWAALDWLAFLVNVDQGFRAPNLNDLTSRQLTGPGYQFENAELDPERSLTVETGLRVDSSRFRMDAWFFWTRLEGAVVRAKRDSDECPAGDRDCGTHWYIYQLDNADAPSTILGVEAMASLSLPWGFTLRATVAYAWGEGPNPGDPPSDPTIEWDAWVPLSRIPPLNGTVELFWRNHPTGIFAGAALRWAATQDRLAPSDRGDARIPLGGTPGYTVLDLRAGWRWNDQVLVALVFENVTDEAYRYHGSSVNGQGRGLTLRLELGL